MKIKTLFSIKPKGKLTGLITISSGTYMFRDDHGYEKGIWAWNIEDNYDKATVHKWHKLPNNHRIELFDVDNPPETVTYNPFLD